MREIFTLTDFWFFNHAVMIARRLIAPASIAFLQACSFSPQEAREHGIRLEVSSEKSLADFAHCSIRQLDNRIRGVVHNIRINEGAGFAEIVSTGLLSDFVSVTEFTRTGPVTTARLYLSANVVLQTAYVEDVRSALDTCR